ncbi:cytochrome c maturation protein CcmE [Aquihabitans sp. McL0605]|uniref:cytochrome c maturation protein CcmE domain-containing protein n=1 Tax=Aquihabitans sp. McL0605 TaxID=3415671 RepID=UPI003CF2CDA7
MTPADLPDDRDLDEGGLDLTPRADVAVSPGRKARRRWAPIVVLCLLGVAVAAIAFQAKGASLYFKNADEAVAQKTSLGTKRFRLQGTVVGKPKVAEEATVFKVQYHGVDVTVRHTGSEPAMFKAGIPVVAEGHWNAAGTEFDSDRLLIKHDADYKDYDKEHPTRVDGDQSNDT